MGGLFILLATQKAILYVEICMKNSLNGTNAINMAKRSQSANLIMCHDP